MSCETVIRVDNLGKCYHVFETPHDRLKQFVLPRVYSYLGLTKRTYFNEFWALQGVSFEVAKGESVGILGRNGSGKSTLLQLITGTLAPTSGSVETQGRVAALLELGSGFNPDFSGRENVFLNLALQGFRQNQIEDKFESIAGFADIGNFIDQPVKMYSSGMYARLAFAAAIHTDPDVLIVDEILAVGDAPFQQKCMNRLYRMLDDGISVLMVSHDAYQIRSICRKALLLEKGRQRLFDLSDRVMDEYVASMGTSGTLANTAKAVTPPESDLVAPEARSGFAISIHHPTLIGEGRRGISQLMSMSPLDIEFEYRLHGNYEGQLSFVVNLYREDDVYIFGTTTGMQSLPAYAPLPVGRVKVSFPSMPLVSGKYKFRVAINDGRGMNILAEAVPVCQFSVTDDFRAVGIVDLPHAWTHEAMQTNGQSSLKQQSTQDERDARFVE